MVCLAYQKILLFILSKLELSSFFIYFVNVILQELSPYRAGNTGYLRSYHCPLLFLQTTSSNEQPLSKDCPSTICTDISTSSHDPTTSQTTTTTTPSTSDVLHSELIGLRSAFDYPLASSSSVGMLCMMIYCRGLCVRMYVQHLMINCECIAVIRTLYFTLFTNKREQFQLKLNELVKLSDLFVLIAWY